GAPAPAPGHAGHHLGGGPPHQVVVGDQAEGAPALAGAAVEHDRAGLGDGHGAAGEHAVEGGQVGRAGGGGAAGGGGPPPRPATCARRPRGTGAPWPPSRSPSSSSSSSPARPGGWSAVR